MTEEIRENEMIGRIVEKFIHAPHKIGKIQETDAELIDLGEESPHILAITTDSLVEEVETGLYQDPYFMGWMLAMINFSDLAAVGAEPLGLLICLNLPFSKEDDFISNLTKGISDACEKVNSFVLGGDTNSCKEVLMSGCGVGLVPKENTITRVGCKPGDKLYLTYPAGKGNFFGFLKFSGQNQAIPDNFFEPIARIKEGKIIRNFASCSMDTSDGVLHTLDQLMRLNDCQFILETEWEKILNHTALHALQAQNIPSWLLLAGVHGEFELCFAVEPERESEFLKAAKKINWVPVFIGKVFEGSGIKFRSQKGLMDVDTAYIRNLSQKANQDPKKYIKELINYALKLDL